MTHIDALAQVAYDEGMNPVDWAAMLAQTEIETFLAITAGRAVDPAAFPIYALELSPAAAARRIVGRLLDAGWTPPSPEPATAPPSDSAVE